MAKKAFITKKTVGIFMTIMIAIIVINIIVELSKPSSSTPNQSSNIPISTSAKVGDNVVLDEGSDFNNSVILATTPTNFNEVSKLIVVGDKVGIAKMVMNGEAFFVDKGTQALIIDGGFTSFQVRIMSGDYYGESGWLPFEFCKKP